MTYSAPKRLFGSKVGLLSEAVKLADGRSRVLSPPSQYALIFTIDRCVPVWP